MAYVKAQLSVPQIEDVNGNPAAGYTISSYLWDTSTPTPMYTSSAGAGSATSFTLNSLGEPQSAGGTAVDIFLDSDITYKFIIRDAGGQQVGPTIGPVYGSPVAVSAGAVNFTQSGTGAIERTASAKMGEVISADDFGVSALNDAATNTTRLASAIVAASAAGRPLKLPPAFTVGRVDIDRNIEFVGEGSVITLSGSGAGFRITGSFDYFKAKNIKFLGDGVVGNNHCGIYTDSGTRNVTEGVIVDVTAQSCVIGIETTPFRRCWIVRPKILTTVGTSSGTGYGIVGAGDNEFLFIDHPYVYRSTRHGIYCGNVKYTQIVAPIFHEHAYGEAAWNKRSALAISRDGECVVTSPQFINCADEIIGIDDEASPTGKQTNISINGGISKSPQGAARTIRIGEGTPSADNGHRNISILGFMFEANATESIYDVNVNHCENVHLDLIVDGNQSYTTDRSFLTLSGGATQSDYIFIKMRGVVSGSGRFTPIRIQDDVALGTQRALIDAAVVGSDDIVSFSTPPTNTNLHITGCKFSEKFVGYFYQPYESVGAAVVGVEGGDAGYGAGISFRSRLSGGSTVKEMGRIAADGEAAWNNTASTQDASVSIYTTQDGTEAVAAKFQRVPTAGMTGLWLWDADNAQLEQVSVGAADSGGAGYKLLRIAN